ncbi:MAG: SOS response-associated peptidase [Ketobacter sp.]|nr:MAG: SOS response-associated peptidase [Ketobacter sp.]
MCGRFNIIDDPAMHGLLHTLGLGLRLPTRVNIAPTEAVPVIKQAGQTVSVHEMRWWLVPSWAPDVSTRYSMFNARSDKLATSKAFRGPFRHKRAVMPVSSYIEWKREGKIKQPYLIKPVGQLAFAFAAIWDQWEKGGIISKAVP